MICILEEWSSETRGTVHFQSFPILYYKSDYITWGGTMTTMIWGLTLLQVLWPIGYRLPLLVASITVAIMCECINQLQFKSTSILLKDIVMIHTKFVGWFPLLWPVTNNNSPEGWYQKTFFNSPWFCSPIIPATYNIVSLHQPPKFVSITCMCTAVYSAKICYSIHTKFQK